MLAVIQGDSCPLGNGRLNRDALSCLEAITPRISWAVVNVQANVVAQVVGEQGVHCLGKSVAIFSS